MCLTCWNLDEILKAVFLTKLSDAKVLQEKFMFKYLNNNNT